MDRPVSRPEYRKRAIEALDALVAVETLRLEVERGILHELFLMRNKNVAYARLFLGVPVPQ